MPRILEKSFNYTPAAKTDIRETFKRAGWTAPSEKQQQNTDLLKEKIARLLSSGTHFV